MTSTLSNDGRNDDWHDRYRRKSDECDSLKEYLKGQSDELLIVQSKLRSTLIKLSESEEKLIPLQYELNKIKRDKAHIDDEYKIIDTDLRKKSSELLDLKLMHTHVLGEIESKLSFATSENNQKQSTIKKLQEDLLQSNKKIDSYAHEVTELKKLQSNVDNSYSIENDALKKRIDMQKIQIDEVLARMNTIQANHEKKIADDTAEVHMLTVNLAKKTSELTIAVEASEKLQVKIDKLEDEIVTLKSSLTAVAVPNVVTIAGYNNINTTATAAPSQLLQKLVEAERQLIVEKNKCSEAEMYLNRILQDQEAKGPLYAKQKKDFNRIVQSHSQLSQQFDAIVAENDDLKNTLQQMNMSVHETSNQVMLQETVNGDLSKQVQHLLKKIHNIQFGSSFTAAAVATTATPSSSLSPTAAGTSSGSGSGSGSGQYQNNSSDYFILFDSIEELQQKNIHLLKVIRKLSQDDSKASDVAVFLNILPAGGNVITGIDEATMSDEVYKELLSIREDREKTQEMVAALIQQRDMYRAMVDEADNLKSKASSIDSINSGNKMQELMYKLSKLDDDNKRLQDKIVRLEDSETVLNSIIDKTKSECTAYRLASSQSTNDVMFYRERLERIEAEHQAAVSDNQMSLQRRSELERILLDSQKESRNKDRLIEEANNTIVTQEDELRRYMIEIEKHKHIEHRLNEKLNGYKEEVKLKSDTDESIRRIESIKYNTIEEEKSVLMHDKEQLLRSIDAMRKQLSDRSLIEDQRMHALEEDVRLTRDMLDSKISELLSIREKYINEQTTSKSLQDKCSLLERQLVMMQERLNVIEASYIIDESKVKESLDKDKIIDALNSDMMELKDELELATTHAEKYKQLMVTNEAIMKELTERSAASKQAYDDDTLKLQKEIATLQQDINDYRVNGLNAAQEIESIRETLRETVRNNRTQLHIVEEEVTIARNATEQYKQQINQYTNDIAKANASCKTWRDNYDHELQLHATAATELCVVREDSDKLREANSTLQQTIGALRTKVSMLELSLEEEKNSLHNAVLPLKERNESLHRHIQHLEEMSTTATTASTTTAVTTTDTANADAVGASTTDAHEVIELKARIKFANREVEILQEEVKSVVAEKDRRIATIEMMQRSIDELALQLQQQQPQRQQQQTSLAPALPGVGVDTSSSRLNLLLESNENLRTEREKERLRADKLAMDLLAAQQAVQPMSDKVRQLSYEKDVLAEEKASLVVDVSHWKESFQQFVSKGSNIDPEEHRQLIGNNKALSDRVSMLQQQLLELTASTERRMNDVIDSNNQKIVELAADRDAIVAELTAQKELIQNELNAQLVRYTTSEEQCSKLRGILRDFKKKVADSDKATAETAAREGVLKAEVEALKNRLLVVEKVPQKQMTSAVASVAPTATATTTPTATATAAVPATQAAPTTATAPTLSTPVSASKRITKGAAAKTPASPTPSVVPVAAVLVAEVPVAAKPVAAQPVAAVPVAAVPVAAVPVAAQPVAAVSVATQPVAAVPVAQLEVTGIEVAGVAAPKVRQRKRKAPAADATAVPPIADITAVPGGPIADATAVPPIADATAVPEGPIADTTAVPGGPIADATVVPPIADATVVPPIADTTVVPPIADTTVSIGEGVAPMSVDTAAPTTNDSAQVADNAAALASVSSAPTSVSADAVEAAATVTSPSATVAPTASAEKNVQDMKAELLLKRKAQALKTSSASVTAAITAAASDAAVDADTPSPEGKSSAKKRKIQPVAKATTATSCEDGEVVDEAIAATPPLLTGLGNAVSKNPFQSTAASSPFPIFGVSALYPLGAPKPSNIFNSSRSKGSGSYMSDSLPVEAEEMAYDDMEVDGNSAVASMSKSTDNSIGAVPTSTGSVSSLLFNANAATATATTSSSSTSSSSTIFEVGRIPATSVFGSSNGPPIGSLFNWPKASPLSAQPVSTLASTPVVAAASAGSIFKQSQAVSFDSIIKQTTPLQTALLTDKPMTADNFIAAAVPAVAVAVAPKKGVKGKPMSPEEVARKKEERSARFLKSDAPTPTPVPTHAATVGDSHEAVVDDSTIESNTEAAPAAVAETAAVTETDTTETIAGVEGNAE